MNQQEIQISENLVFTVSQEIMPEIIVTDPLNDLQTLFKERHWGWRHSGQGGMIFSRLDKEHWFYEPTTLEVPDLPEMAITRAKAILERGIKVQGWIIGHEKVPEPEPQERRSDLEIGKVILTVALVLLAVLSVGFLSFLLPLAWGVTETGRGVANVLHHIDPVLCCVLSDENQTIVEIYRWIND